MSTSANLLKLCQVGDCESGDGTVVDVPVHSNELSPASCEISVDYTEEFDPKLNQMQGQVSYHFACKKHVYYFDYHIFFKENKEPGLLTDFLG